MASHVTTEAERNDTILPSVRIISSNIEKIMSFEGFDIARKVFQSWISWKEKALSLFDTPQEPQARIYGSIGEGIIYPLDSFYDRDIDVVKILPKNIAVENVHETYQYGSEKRIYLIENVPNRPGYCYLRVINEGSMLSFPNTMISLTKEVYGCQYFSGLALNETVKTAMTICKTPISFVNNFRDVCTNPNLDLEVNQQGPAALFRFNVQIQCRNTIISFTKCDSVCVVHCPKWPSSAFGWLNRKSRSGWPCQELKQEIAHKGICFAPIGCKHDPFQEIQWRYSFNEAERLLVRSFNSPQAKCYALLKRIIAEFVKPWFSDDVITSYHLKTLMFWEVEEVDLQAWVPANLVECIFRVLKRLTQCIENENCPSYFIPTENLFLERATLEHKEAVLARMHDILSEGWSLLFRLPTLLMKYNVLSTMLRFIWTEFDDIIDNIISFVDLNQPWSSNAELLLICMYLAELDIYEIHETIAINAKFIEIIQKHTTKMYSVRDERVKEVLKNVTARLYSSYGTQCLSLARLAVSDMSRTSRNVESAGEIDIEISCLRNQVDCLAKRANYAYMCGKFHSTISTAFDLLQRYRHLPVNAINVDVSVNEQLNHFYQQILSYAMENGVQMLLTKNFTPVFDYMANFVSSNEVIFAKNEIYAVPGNAKVEMFKVECEEDRLNPFYKFRTCLFVDPYFYVTFLAFQAYYDMGNQEGTDTVIEIMEIICSAPPNSHLPTSLNLLADCYIKTCHIDKAMEKFNLSMKINKWRNAAAWHIARLLWRKLLCRWSKTRDGDL